MRNNTISLVIVSFLLTQSVFANGPSTTNSETKTPEKPPVISPAAQPSNATASHTLPQQAIEILMPDGTKRVGAIIDGKFIPLDGAVMPAATPAPAKTEDDPLWHKNTYEKKIFYIGQRILEKNNIQDKISFRIIHGRSVVNAYGSHAVNEVQVEEGLLSFVENDDELAAVLSHEIAHIELKHKTYNIPSGNKKTIFGANRRVAIILAAVDPASLIGYEIGSMIKNGIARVQEGPSQRQETEADLKGLEFLKQAGYSPTAMRTIMLKITSDGDKNVWRSHPLGSTRIADIDKKISEMDHPKIQTNQPVLVSVKKNDPAMAEKPVAAESKSVVIPSGTQPKDNASTTSQISKSKQ